MKTSSQTRHRVVRALCGLMFYVPFVLGAQEPARPRWVTSWGASLVEVPARNQLTLTNQTLRQVVLSTVGGTSARIRLSNAASSHAVTIGRAQLAVSDTGASVISSSSRDITFGGRGSVVVPAGATIESDPVALAVPALTPIAVSLYLPDSTAVTAIALAGKQLSYTSEPGDHSRADVFPVQSVRAGWTWLVGLDVVNETADGVVVVLGSSIAGGGINASPGNRYPDVLARRLLSSSTAPQLGVITATINGNRIVSGGRGAPLLARFERDVLGQSGVTHVIIAEGLNDISFSGANGPTARTLSDIQQGLIELARRAREKGLRVLAGTLTPSEGTQYGVPAREFGPREEALRMALNSWIRSAPHFDAVIDFDACVRDPDRPSRLRTAYDFGDHLHLNDAGYRALGECIDLALLRSSR